MHVAMMNGGYKRVSCGKQWLCSIPYAYFVPYAYGMYHTRMVHTIRVRYDFPYHTRTV